MEQIDAHGAPLPRKQVVILFNRYLCKKYIFTVLRSRFLLNIMFSYYHFDYYNEDCAKQLPTFFIFKCKNKIALVTRVVLIL